MYFLLSKLLIRRGQSLPSRKNSLLQIRLGFAIFKKIFKKIFFPYVLNFNNLYSLRTLFTPAQNAFISGGSFAESKWIWIRANLSLLTWLLWAKGQKGIDGKSWGNYIFLFSWHFFQGFKWWHIFIGGKLIPLDWQAQLKKKRGFWASFLLNPRKENNSTDQKIYGWIFKYILKQNL